MSSWMLATLPQRPFPTNALLAHRHPWPPRSSSVSRPTGAARTLTARCCLPHMVVIALMTCTVVLDDGHSPQCTELISVWCDGRLCACMGVRETTVFESIAAMTICGRRRAPKTGTAPLFISKHIDWPHPSRRHVWSPPHMYVMHNIWYIIL